MTTSLPTHDQPSSTINTASASGFFSFGRIEIPVLLIWTYIIIKLFFVDVDVLLFQAFIPNYIWLLNYKFFALLGLLATWLAFANRKNAFLMFAFFAAYPLLILFWRIPKAILGRRSWVLAFVALNFVVEFVRSFRRNVIVAAVLCIACMMAIVSDNRYLLWISGSVLLALTVMIYGRALITAFRSPNYFGIYKSFFPAVRNYVITNGKLDAEIRAVPAANRNEVQQKAWAGKIEVPLLTNRIYLFLARRFREYQKSPVPYAATLFQIAFLFFLMVFSFACINFAAYKIDPTGFETIKTSLFSFFWYSFNATLFNSVKEIVPIGSLPQSLWMIEAGLALFLVAILIGFLISVKSQRSANEMDSLIAAMESESRELETFVKSEYEIASIDEAVAELERLKAGLFQILLWLTKNTR